ncbi:hypothetical protein QE152_g11303 [Popillia japonica]|uniref:Uncharacterized protein n=1 Tax=Popillia japonica TaxID=7064 RepID=A0AAW1LR11_POPJA
MKLVFAIFFVLGCASARYRGPSNRVLESEIQNIIDCGLRLIPDPVDEPEAATVLDDLEIEGLSGTAAVVNAYVSGISNYRVRPALQGLNSGIITGLYNDEEFSRQLTEDFLNDPAGTMAGYADMNGLYNDEEFSRQLTEDFLNDPAGTMAGYADMVDQIASSIAGKVVDNALAGDGDAGFLDNC